MEKKGEKVVILNQAVRNKRGSGGLSAPIRRAPLGMKVEVFFFFIKKKGKLNLMFFLLQM